MDSVSATTHDPDSRTPRSPWGAPGPRRLIWEVKPSLIAYLRAVPDGVISGPLTEAGFAFDASCDDTGEILSHGRIRLTAHAGELDIVIGDLRVVHDGQTGALSALTAPDSEERRDIARLGPVDHHGEAATIADVALTHDGAALFQGNYAPYTRMAPLTITRSGSAAKTGR